jgi:GGDEF domain-containing protein
LKKEASATTVVLEGGVSLSISISIGVARFPQDGADAESLICRSDERMYLDKRNSALEAVHSLPTPGPPQWTPLAASGNSESRVLN